ncbi:MAG: hypothetical protein WC052_05275 [Patescibacteria group bacterium]
MATIAGFSTKKDVAEQLAVAGVSVKLPFTTVGPLTVSKNDLAAFDVVDAEGNPQQIIVN